MNLNNAKNKIDELVKKDEQAKNITAKTYNYLENQIFIQPADVISYLDKVSTYTCRQNIYKEKYQPLLLEPKSMPAVLLKVLKNLSAMEVINTDPKKIISPGVYSLRFYKDIYKYRKVYIDNKLKFQLEYTCEIVEDLWLYILTQELRRVNPNSILKFKWIHQPKEDFIDGYYTYISAYTNNDSLEFEYCEFIVNNMYNRLKVLTKLDMLSVRFYPCLRNFPKYERNGMASEIRKLFIQISALIEEAGNCKSIRKTKYQEAIGKLYELIRIITLAENLKYISINNGINTRIAINEIIAMTRSLLQTELSGLKTGTLRLSTK